jgi:hypothetical protein
VPNWHQDVLSERLAALDAGEAVATPWEEAKERIRDRAKHLTRPE